MTRSEVLFNYRQAIRQAEKLETIATRLDKLSSNKMENTVGTLRTVWQSDSSPQYYNKVGKVQGDIKSTARNVRKISQAIRDTAENVKRAELRALEIARSRTYK